MNAIFYLIIFFSFLEQGKFRVNGRNQALNYKNVVIKYFKTKEELFKNKHKIRRIHWWSFCTIVNLNLFNEMFSHFLIFLQFFFWKVLKFCRLRLQQIYLWANIFHAISILTMIHLFGLMLKNRRLSPRDAQGHDTFLVNHSILRCHVQFERFDTQNGWIASKGKKVVYWNAFGHGKAPHCESLYYWNWEVDWEKAAQKWKSIGLKWC